MHAILGIFRHVTRKDFLYVSSPLKRTLGKTAAVDTNGTWHVGNVYDMADVAYGIAQNGIVEPAETKIVQQILSFQTRNQTEKITFYDIGANIGYYGLIAATQHGAQVESFEPLPQHIECIEAARIINKCEDSLTVHKVALSDKVGVAVITEVGSGSSLVPNFNGEKKIPTIEIPTTTIDDLVSQTQMPSPDFMMIDVEGHELSVLKGASNTITSNLPVVFFEICQSIPERNFINEHYQKTLQWLQEKEYRVYVLTDTGVLKLLQNNHKNGGIEMYLALHVNKHANVLHHLQSNALLTQ